MVSRGASDLASITRHAYNWALSSLWLCLCIPPGVISPLLSSNVSGTYRPGEFIFQCHVFLPFHPVRGVLKARILKWFAIPLVIQQRTMNPWEFDFGGQCDLITELPQD